MKIKMLLTISSSLSIIQSAFSADLSSTELKNIGLKSKDIIKKYFVTPSKISCSAVKYQFDEIKLLPKESLYFKVPDELKHRPVKFMILKHRQDIDNTLLTHFDVRPGLSSVQVYSKNNWYYWGGSSSGKKGAKFAEAGKDSTEMELENLYEWDHFGHYNTQTEKKEEGDLFAEAYKVESMGIDPVYIGEVSLKIEPESENSHLEKIYTPGTKFTPQDKNKKFYLGGGQNKKGTYPDAHVLNDNDELIIPLPEGQIITNIDVACGDSFPDGLKNSDGGWGKKGWAEMSVGLRNKNGETRWFMKNENVPPEGVLIASPDDCNEIAPKESAIVIKNKGEPNYIMGVHIGFKN